MINRQNDRQHVAWDLETTGFAWSDQITVSGFWFPGGHIELIINTDGEVLDAEDAEARLENVSDGVSVDVTVADDEPSLLEAMQQILFDRFDTNYNRLVAFNAESWKSGFDLPFLRTRCLKENHERGYKFATLTIVAEDTPIVLAIEPVRDHRKWESDDIETRSRGELVDSLLEQAQQHVEISKVFADREFDSYAVRDATDRRGIFYIQGKRKQAEEDKVNITEIVEHEVADIWGGTWETHPQGSYA